MFKNAIILSGGEGVRMRPLTKYIPKALVEFNGVPLIRNILNLLNTYEVKDIYVTYNYLSEILFKNLKNDVRGFINTTNKDNSHFLFNSFLKHIEEPIIIVPCDLIVDIDLKELYDDYVALGQPAIMLVGVQPKNGVAGDYIEIGDNNIVTVLDRNKITELYCSGIQIINPSMVNLLCKPEDNFYNVWKQLIKTNNLKVSNKYPTKWEAFDEIKQIL